MEIGIIFFTLEREERRMQEGLAKLMTNNGYPRGIDEQSL